jgi:hypothetical protein
MLELREMIGKDFEARQATLSKMVYNAQSVARDQLPVAETECLEDHETVDHIIWK